MRILITGGTGFIGARLLVAAHQHHDLHTLTNTRPAAYGQSHPAPLTDAEAVRAVVTSVAPDAVIHLAAAGVRPGERDLSHMLAVNVAGLQTLLDAAAALPTPPHIVIAGSWFEYRPPDEPHPFREEDPLSAWLAYSATKMAAAAVAEHYARHGLPITILRVFSVYGVGEPLPRLAPYIIQQTAAGESVDLTGCEQVRDYVFADEIAEGFLRAAAVPPTDDMLRVLNLGTGRGVRLRDFVETLGEVLRARGHTPRFHFGARPYRDNETMYAVADVIRLQNRLGWTPGTVSLSDGLARTVSAQLGGSSGV